MSRNYRITYLMKITLRNFRSIKRATIDIQPGLNVMLGPNGAGKSNLLEGLALLRDVFADGVGLAVAKHGGMQRAVRRGAKEIGFRIEENLGTRPIPSGMSELTVLWEIALHADRSDGIASLRRESLVIRDSSSTQPVISFSFDAKTGRTSFRLRSAKSIKAGTLVPPQYDGDDRFRRNVHQHLRELLTEVKKESKRLGDVPRMSRLQALDRSLQQSIQQLLSMKQYNIQPELVRRARAQQPVAELLPSGEGLSDVIHALEERDFQRLAAEPFGVRGSRTVLYRRYVEWHDYYRFKFGRDSKGSLANALAQINDALAAAVPSLSSVGTSFEQSSGRRFVSFRGGHITFSPYEVSDGTIKWVALLAALYVPTAGVFVVEEPENYLHPWMQKELLVRMRDLARRDGTAFILTTHSASILNACEPSEISLIEHGNNGTVIHRAQQGARLRAVIERAAAGIGDIWVSGLIGAVPLRA